MVSESKMTSRSVSTRATRANNDPVTVMSAARCWRVTERADWVLSHSQALMSALKY